MDTFTISTRLLHIYENFYCYTYQHVPCISIDTTAYLFTHSLVILSTLPMFIFNYLLFLNNLRFLLQSLHLLITKNPSFRFPLSLSPLFALYCVYFGGNMYRFSFKTFPLYLNQKNNQESGRRHIPAHGKQDGATGDVGGWFFRPSV